MAVAFVVLIVTGCPRFLYVGSSVPAIEIFNIKEDINGRPQMARTTGIALSPSIGNPSAMTVVNKTLYVAGSGSVVGGASVAQFTIDPMSGALTLRGTVPSGNPPHYMAATKTTLSELVNELPRMAMIKDKMVLSREQLTASIARLSDELQAESVSTADGIRLDWADSWLLLRASNTEPIVRLIAETPTEFQSRELIARAKSIIAS